MTVYALGSQERDPTKQNMALQDHAKKIGDNTTTIASHTASIAALNAAATAQAAPTNPTGTVSVSQVMMGLGGTCKITPAYSGRLDIRFHGTLSNNTANIITLAQARFGTGTAPSNSAASTGTAVGAELSAVTNSANYSFPVCIGGIITGLSVGTQYWFDIGLKVGNVAGTGSITSISFSAVEV